MSEAEPIFQGNDKTISVDTVSGVLVYLRDAAIRDSTLAPEVAQRAGIPIVLPDQASDPQAPVVLHAVPRMDNRTFIAYYTLSLIRRPDVADAVSATVFRLFDARVQIEQERHESVRNASLLRVAQLLTPERREEIRVAYRTHTEQQEQNKIELAARAAGKMEQRKYDEKWSSFYASVQYSLGYLPSSKKRLQRIFAEMPSSTESMQDYIICVTDAIVVMNERDIAEAQQVYESRNIFPEKAQEMAIENYWKGIYMVLGHLVVAEIVPATVKQRLVNERLVKDLSTAEPVPHHEALNFLQNAMQTGELVHQGGITGENSPAFMSELLRVYREADNWQTRERILLFLRNTGRDARLIIPEDMYQTILDSYFDFPSQSGFNFYDRFSPVLADAVSTLMKRQIALGERSPENVIDDIRQLADRTLSEDSGHYSRYRVQRLLEHVSYFLYSDHDAAQKANQPTFHGFRDRFASVAIETWSELLNYQASIYMLAAEEAAIPIAQRINLLPQFKTHLMHSETVVVGGESHVYTYFQLSQRLEDVLWNKKYPDIVRTIARTWVAEVMEQRDRLLTDIASGDPDASQQLEFIAGYLRSAEDLLKAPMPRGGGGGFL